MTFRTLPAAAAIIISAFAGASCSDDPAPAGPTPLPTTFVFTSTLTPGNEVPPVTNADSTGSGTLTMTMTVTRDSAGAITAATTVFVVNMTGFPAGTSLTGAHIHANVAGATAGVYLSTGLSATPLATGAGSFTQSAVATTAAQADAMIANPAGYYFNVHTTLSPGGAIRGQLVRQ